MTLPIFETTRLILKEVRLTDADAYQKYFNDYEIISHLAAGVPWPYPADGAINFIKSCILPNQGKDRWVWGIFLKSNPEELIGVVDLWRPGHPENRGFWLARKFWGQGLMSEAVTPITDYAFEHLGFDRLVFANALGNKKSRRVKEKAGAQMIRVSPAQFVNPEYKEHEIWELTKEQWHVRRSSPRPI